MISTLIIIAILLVALILIAAWAGPFHCHEYLELGRAKIEEEAWVRTVDEWFPEEKIEYIRCVVVSIKRCSCGDEKGFRFYNDHKQVPNIESPDRIDPEYARELIRKHGGVVIENKVETE